jgi:hypothetical protein
MSGFDEGDGTTARPFGTISAAAAVARPGDTIRVAGGVYREQVDPPRGGTDDAPISYIAADCEEVVITGSDLAPDWDHVSGNVWRHRFSNSQFGALNRTRTSSEGTGSTRLAGCTTPAASIATGSG